MAKAKAKTTKQLTKDVNTLMSNLRSQEVLKYFTFENEEVIKPAGTDAQIANGEERQIPIFKICNDLNLGLNKDQMRGTSVSMTGIGFRYLLHNTSQYATMVRILLIKTKYGEELTENGEDLFLSDVGYGYPYTSTSSYNSQNELQLNERQRFYLRSNRHKYNIIYDKTHILDAKSAGSNSTTSIRSNKIVKFFKPYKDQKITFDGDGHPNTKYYIAMFPIDCGMDGQQINQAIEVTGSTTFYYKDQ